MNHICPTAGYDDWPVLRNLTDEDLDTIARCSAITILPGHRKKLLLASKELGVQVRCTCCEMLPYLEEVGKGGTGPTLGNVGNPWNSHLTVQTRNHRDGHI